MKILPRWLMLVKGVVDSDDLPLNVTREILQKSKVLNIINNGLVRKSLDMIRDMVEDDFGTTSANISKFLHPVRVYLDYLFLHVNSRLKLYIQSNIGPKST